MYSTIGDIYKDLKCHYGKIFPYTEEEFKELVRRMMDDEEEQVKSKGRTPFPDEHSL